MWKSRTEIQNVYRQRLKEKNNADYLQREKVFLCKSLNLRYIETGLKLSTYLFTPSYKEIKHVSILMISRIVVHTEFSIYLIHNNWNKAHMCAVKNREQVEQCRRLSNRTSDTNENKFILYSFIWKV